MIRSGSEGKSQRPGRPRGCVNALQIQWRPILAGLALALGSSACTRTNEERSAEIPSQMHGTLDAEYALAVDSSRIAAKSHVANRFLPSASVAVGLDGEVVWAEAFGWADLSGKTLATPETLYPVGSISKPLTATAAGLLYERGMLDFDLPIQEYIPEFPEKRWTVTTRQLMGHIAGIRNYGAPEALRQAHCDNARAGVAAVAGDTLLHAPGSEYAYSNYGFRLVGAIVEAAAGEPFLDFMQREVFDALGLERTVPDVGPKTGPARATFYDPRDFRTLRHAQDIDMSCSMSAGGFLSTPTELVRFGFAMLHAEILERETVDMFWTPQRLDSGAPTNYGMGWQIGAARLGDDAAETRFIAHGGAVLGGQASLIIFPDEDMVVAAMTNTSADVAALGRQIATYFRDRPGG